jgi:hypothetical protein
MDKFLVFSLYKKHFSFNIKPHAVPVFKKSLNWIFRRGENSTHQPPTQKKSGNKERIEIKRIDFEFSLSPKNK